MLAPRIDNGRRASQVTAQLEVSVRSLLASENLTKINLGLRLAMYFYFMHQHMNAIANRNSGGH
jgi:hypothetical protein